MRNLLGQHIFITCNLSWPKDGIYRVLRRINRETKSQYISDVQRFAEVKWTRGNRSIDWEKQIWMQRIARRFRKDKLFNEDGTFSSRYGDVTVVDSRDFSAMISDTPFDEMFRVVKGNGSDDLFEHDLKTFSKKLGIFGKLHRKTNKDGFLLQDVCIDTESHIGQSLSKVFNLDVYVADRLWCDKRFVGEQYCGHNHRFEYNRDCDFDRNAVFHQVTSSGGDKKIISKEDNNHNSPVFLWFFKDRIVYKEDSGRSEH